MPLRDHFRLPAEDDAPWESLHGGWPMVIVQYLFGKLPAGYVAMPKAHAGQPIEVDFATYRADSAPPPNPPPADGGVVAALAELGTAPTLTVVTDFSDPDEFEVKVYDERRRRRLVAAIEIVSPGNKDRPDARRAFAAKCAALIQQDVCVSIVDLVTDHHFNLYAELMGLIGRPDPALGADPSPVYCATLRGRKRFGLRPVIDLWYDPMAVGRPLPPLQLWLREDVMVRLDLEATYEETCRLLHIR